MKIRKRLSRLIISTICTASIMLCSMPVMTAGAETYGVLTYEKVDEDNDGKYDYVVIEGCDKSAASVNIPSKIDGLPVTNIGNEAFRACTVLKSVNIPSSVVSIGRYAFFFCKSLSSVTIPNSVTTIEDNAFNECESLKSLKIPNSVTKIGYSAFSNDINLTEINIPYNITSIEFGLFSFCESLKSITIPGSVTSIGESAFHGCKSLESITIPVSVTSIGDCTFADCRSLKSVTIPSNVKSIDYEAFARCKSLDSIIIMNPDCNIYNSAETIYSKWSGSEYFFEGMIYGKEKSSAETYADEYNCKFLAVNEYGIIGDADGDGKVSAKDASLLFTEYKSVYNGGESTFTEGRLGRCDANGDGKITAADASKAFSTYKKNYRKG